eukprot:6591970-Pyramimonas_sp.AAC.1
MRPAQQGVNSIVREVNSKAQGVISYLHEARSAGGEFNRAEGEFTSSEVEFTPARSRPPSAPPPPRGRGEWTAPARAAPPAPGASSV